MLARVSGYDFGFTVAKTACWSAGKSSEYALSEVWVFST